MKKWRLAALTAMAAMALAACGGSSEETTAAAATTASPGPETSLDCSISSRTRRAHAAGPHITGP